MDITAAISRLQAQLTGFVSIGGAADADIAVQNAPATPAACVVPLAESAEPNTLLGVTDQRITLEFGVVLIVANLRDSTGLAASVELATRRLALRAALVGWVPEPATGEPVEFVGGELLHFQDQRLWWRDVFRVKTYYRSA